MEKHSKRYRSSLQVSDLAKDYPLAEAVDILAKFPKAKFALAEGGIGWIPVGCRRSLDRLNVSRVCLVSFLER